MSGASIANQLCVYFGGPYDSATHTYRTPQITVPNMSPVVRRAAPKKDDHQSDYWATATPTGIPVGCLMLVLMAKGEERRVAVAGATSGVKEVDWSAQIHCFLRGEENYAEDLQDGLYALLDAIRGHIEADRTCGTGGFEAGYGLGFQAGEAGKWMRWDISPVHTTPRQLSKAYLMVEFDAVEFIQA